MSGTPLKKTTLDIALTFSRQFLAGLIQLGILLIIARSLGPERTGMYAVALLLPTVMAQVLNLGLASANVYFLAAGLFPLQQIWGASRDLIVSMIALGLGLGLAVIALLNEIVFPGVPQAFLLLALMIFPSNLLMGVVSSLFQALEDFRAFNITVIVQPALALCGICALWFAGSMSVMSVLTIVSMSHAVALCGALLLLGKRTSLIDMGIARVEYLRPAIRYGVKAHLGNILTFLNYRLDMFLVNLLAGPAAVGVYSVAVRLTEQLWLISQAVSTVILPRLSAMGNDVNARSSFVPLMARSVFWATTAAGAFLAAISQPLINLLFGAEFAEAAIVILILLPGIVLFSLGRVLANDFASRGWVGLNLILAGVVLIFNTIANLALIPIYGAAGAAMATSAAYIVSVIIRLALQNRLTDIPLIECFVFSRSDFAMVARYFGKRS